VKEFVWAPQWVPAVIPLVASAMVPVLVIGPPVSPAPVPTLITIPVLGKVCPAASDYAGGSDRTGADLPNTVVFKITNKVYADLKAF